MTESGNFGCFDQCLAALLADLCVRHTGLGAGCFLAGDGLFGVLCNGYCTGFNMRSVICTNSLFKTLCGAGGRRCDCPFAVLVADCLIGYGRSADFRAADGAFNNFVVRAVGFAGRGNDVLIDCLAGSMLCKVGRTGFGFAALVALTGSGFLALFGAGGFLRFSPLAPIVSECAYCRCFGSAAFAFANLFAVLCAGRCGGFLPLAVGMSFGGVLCGNGKRALNISDIFIPAAE